MKKIIGLFALVFVLAGFPARADVVRPGDTVEYRCAHKHIKSGNYTIMLVDANNHATAVQGAVYHGDLSFQCPQLTPGYYQIESFENQLTHKVSYGHLNDEDGFVVAPPSRHKK